MDPMAESNDEQISQAERMRRSNKEMWAQWAIDVHQDPASVPLEEINPGHPMLFEANTVLPYFERLRREDPVHRCEASQFGPYWSVTRYEDIMYVDTHHKIFSSDSRKGGIQLGGVADPDPDPTFHLPMFIMEDPPKHDEQRKVIAPMFTPRHLAGLEDVIRERAGAILDGLPRNEEFNWVREVSVELTGRMLATLFAVPQEDRHKLIHWSDVTQSIGDPDVFETPEEGFAELWKCWEYFDAVWKDRVARNEPGDDLISMLVHGESTRNMPPNEYLGNILLLIVGGNDTTRNSISGGVLALNQFPDQYAKLRSRGDSTMPRRATVSARSRTGADRAWRADMGLPGGGGTSPGSMAGRGGGSIGRSPEPRPGPAGTGSGRASPQAGMRTGSSRIPRMKLERR
jgi:cytochrome P450